MSLSACSGQNPHIRTRISIWVSCACLWAGQCLQSAESSDIAALRAQLAAAEEAKDKPAVIEISRRIVEVAPSDSHAWEKLVDMQLEIKDFQRCGATLDAWEKAAKPSPAIIEKLRGDLADAQDDSKNAERHWLAFVAKNPPAGEAALTYDKLGELCVPQARWRECGEFRLRAVQLSDNAARRVSRATILLRLRQWDAAFAEMKKANAMDAADDTVKEWLPQFERLQKFVSRIKALDAQIAKIPNDPALWLDRARLFTLAGRPLLALDDCEHAMTLPPPLMRARIQTGEALQDTERTEDAALKLRVSHDLVRGGDQHVSERALRDLAEKDARVLQNPGNAEALAARAKSLRLLKQFAIALEDAQAALALDEKSDAAHFEAAHDFDGLGKAKEALAHIITATELNPGDPVMWYYRGVLEAQRANFTCAVESQTRSLTIRESLVALRERERCERRTGRAREADADAARIAALSAQRQP